MSADTLPGDAFDLALEAFAGTFADGTPLTINEALLRALLAAAPSIAEQERQRYERNLEALRAVISPERFRDIADWFDTDDEFKMTMFPETWPPLVRGHETQDDLRKFADLLGGAGQKRSDEKGESR